MSADHARAYIAWRYEEPDAMYDVNPGDMVTVAAFYQRALRVWERAGFRETQRFNHPVDQLEFTVLVRHVQSF